MQSNGARIRLSTLARLVGNSGNFRSFHSWRFWSFTVTAEVGPSDDRSRVYTRLGGARAQRFGDRRLNDFNLKRSDTRAGADLTGHLAGQILIAPTGRAGKALVRGNDGRVLTMPRGQFAVGWTEHRHHGHVERAGGVQEAGIDAYHRVKRRNQRDRLRQGQPGR
jgi:hypothetical protein